MSQRASGYARRPNEDYGTPPWVAQAIADHLHLCNVVRIWEPAAGEGKLAAALTAQGFDVVATRGDFHAIAAPPRPVDAIITNPPYGAGRRNELACAFIRHALAMPVKVVGMLLRVDFDSAKTRVDLFRDNHRFAGKVVLLDRIMWFKGLSGPSDNHAWFFWDHPHRFKRPWTAYAVNPEKAKR